jgi:hypothetical protein
MKRVRFYAALTVACGLIIARAAADPTSEPSDPSTIPEQDTESVPKMVVEAKAKLARQAAAEAEKEQTQVQAQNKDWLLRSYEEQRQASGKSGEENDNLYYRLSTDKTLSRMAGISSIDPAVQASSSTKDAVVTPTSAPTSSEPSRTESSSLKSASTGPEDKTGLHDFYSNLNGDTPPADVPASSAPVTPEPVKDMAATMDSPGLTAAQSNPQNYPDLNYDLSSSEPLPQDGSHKDDGALYQGSSTGTNPDQLQKSGEALNVPSASQTSQASQPPPVNTNQKTYEDDAPKPDRIPQPSPVREPIGNPLDIPYH